MQVQVIPKLFSITFPQHAVHGDVDHVNGPGENIRIRSVVDRDLQVVVADVRTGFAIPLIDPQRIPDVIVKTSILCVIFPLI